MIMRPTVMEKQEMICRIGELAEEIFVLKSGEAQIFHPPSARGTGRAAEGDAVGQLLRGRIYAWAAAV